MSGVITTRHLLLHALTIVREFGPRAYLRCWARTLTAAGPVTFLGCLYER
jgi:hypothetical protein